MKKLLTVLSLTLLSFILQAQTTFNKREAKAVDILNYVEQEYGRYATSSQTHTIKCNCIVVGEIDGVKHAFDSTTCEIRAKAFFRAKDLFSKNEFMFLNPKMYVKIGDKFYPSYNFTSIAYPTFYTDKKDMEYIGYLDEMMSVEVVKKYVPESVRQSVIQYIKKIQEELNGDKETGSNFESDKGY